MHGALWRKAPFVLVRHPGALVAVVSAAFLVALAAGSAPLLRAGAESQALKSKVSELTPLAAGLVIRTPPARFEHLEAGQAARLAALRQLGRSLPGTAAPVVTTEVPWALVDNRAAQTFAPNGLGVVPMARTSARAHVKLIAGGGTNGVWIAQSVAKTARLKPGDSITLAGAPGPGAPPKPVSFRVAAVYRTLDADLENPYWANFIQDIRSPNPDSPPLPTFVLMSTADLYRAAQAIGGSTVENIYELPLAPGEITLSRAKHLRRQFAEAQTQIIAGRNPLARALGCNEQWRAQVLHCLSTSSLTSALTLAEQSVQALTPTLALLAGFGSLLALAAALSAGVFGVRRRAGEAFLLQVRGERAAVFAARTALEALLPALAGGAAGYGTALLFTGLFTPHGTIDGGVARAALVTAALATVAAIAAVSLGAAAGFSGAGRASLRLPRWARIPWEAFALAAAAALFVVLDLGGGLVSNGDAGSHPRLTVFLLPLLLAAGLSGLLTRAGRRLLRRSRAPHRHALYLALRRLAAARGLLVLLTVTAAVSFGAFTYAEALASSLSVNTGLKAYVANGSDVSSIVDPQEPLPRNFPYPLAKVSQDFNTARLNPEGGGNVELLAGDPEAIAAVVHWRNAWGRDPRPALRSLEQAPDRPLPLLATRDAGSPDAIWLEGQRVPVQIVGRVAAFPGMTVGYPLLVVSQRQLTLAERAHGISTQVQLPYSLLWAKGPPHAVSAALVEHGIDAYYLTSVAETIDSPNVTSVTRTYGFMRAIAVAAGLLALVSLLLYLQARQRSQLVSNAFLRRMGMPERAQALSLAIESAALVLFSTIAGAAGALIAARSLIPHVDPLPKLPPAAVLHTPWLLLSAAVLVAVATAALAGAVATIVAARGKVGEALRVA